MLSSVLRSPRVAQVNFMRGFVRKRDAGMPVGSPKPARVWLWEVLFEKPHYSFNIVRSFEKGA
jgi:hypothetical protein